MGRLILVLVVLAFSGIVYLVKAGASKVTGNENVNFKDESKKMMERTARGVQWMNDQWERAKISARSGTSQVEETGGLKHLSANEIIRRLDKYTDTYTEEEKFSLLIDLAIYKMGSRKFEDAETLVRQLPESESRRSMLVEINQKRSFNAD